MIRLKSETTGNVSVDSTLLIISRELLKKMDVILVQDAYDRFSAHDETFEFYENDADTDPVELLTNKLKKQQENYTISTGFLYRLLEKLDENVQFQISMGSSNLPDGQYNQYVEEYYKQMKNQELKSYYQQLILNKDFNSLEQFIALECNLILEHDRLLLLRDLNKSKEHLLKDLKYVCSEEEFAYYQTYLSHNTFDIANLKRVLKLGQERILKDWKDQITDISSYQVGNPFAFLCHSMLHNDFEGAHFHTKYVSTSLLTENLWDTYSYGYGFILSPDTIVSASSRDTYSMNNAITDSKIFMYSDVASIFSKQRIEEECIALKKKNLEEGNKEKVYSEILVKGFHPLGVFCITDGSKMDYNYKHAVALKKNITLHYPNLPIVELDKTFYCSEKQRKTMFTGILDHLEKETGVSKAEYSTYEPMFIDFMVSKKEGTYDVDDLKKQYIKASEQHVIKEKQKF